MLEEYQFWSDKKTKFWVGVFILVFAALALAFVGFAWILYQEKVQASGQDSNQQPPPAATPSTAAGTSSTNALAPSLSPLTPATNSN